MVDRDEVTKQIDRWLVLLREEALVLLEKGVGPMELIPLAIKVADARLNAEVLSARATALAIPGMLGRSSRK